MLSPLGTHHGPGHTRPRHCSHSRPAARRPGPASSRSGTALGSTVSSHEQALTLAQASGSESLATTLVTGPGGLACLLADSYTRTGFIGYHPGLPACFSESASGPPVPPEPARTLCFSLPLRFRPLVYFPEGSQQVQVHYPRGPLSWRSDHPDRAHNTPLDPGHLQHYYPWHGQPFVAGQARQAALSQPPFAALRRRAEGCVRGGARGAVRRGGGVCPLTS